MPLFKTGGNQPICVDVNEFKGGKYLDIRKYFSSDTGELKPTMKGISMNKEQFISVISYIKEHEAEILAGL